MRRRHTKRSAATTIIGAATLFVYMVIGVVAGKDYAATMGPFLVMAAGVIISLSAGTMKVGYEPDDTKVSRKLKSVLLLISNAGILLFLISLSGVFYSIIALSDDNSRLTIGLPAVLGVAAGVLAMQISDYIYGERAS